MKNEANEFGSIFKELRLEQALTQVELAKALGVSKGVISLWENSLREPTLSSLVAIARYFDVSIDYLAGLELDRICARKTRS